MKVTRVLWQWDIAPYLICPPSSTYARIVEYQGGENWFASGDNDSKTIL